MAYMTGSSDEEMKKAAQKVVDWHNRITTIEMLLDAKWLPDKQLFVKRVNRTHANGLATYFELFYNKLGEEVPRPKGYRSA